MSGRQQYLDLSREYYEHQACVNSPMAVVDRYSDWEHRLANLVRTVYQLDATGHDYYHSLRVRATALRIQKSVGGDRDVLSAVAFLHDIGHVLDPHSNDHALVSAEAAPRFLADVGFPENRWWHIIGCVRYHDHFADETPSPWRDVPELSIIQDADRIDAIGAIGIARAFAYGGATGKPIWVPGSQIEHVEWKQTAESLNSVIHFYEKLLKIEAYLNTRVAELIAIERIMYMRDFLRRFFREWAGII